MKYIILPLLFLFSFMGTLQAQGKFKTAEQATIELHAFLTAQHRPTAYKQVEHRTDAAGHVLLYIFHLGDGAVVVGGHPALRSILAYIPEGDITRLSAQHPLHLWLSAFAAANETAFANGMPALSPQVSFSKSGSTLQRVEPLLRSRWGQGKPYNLFTPYDPLSSDNKHCVTGCVSTAMAQLLFHYRFPQIGEGSFSYHHQTYGRLSASFIDQPYDWDKMCDLGININPITSHLISDCGISVKMNYGPTGSSAWGYEVADAMKLYFRYQDDVYILGRNSYQGNWDSLLVAELNQGRPMYYDGGDDTSGHAFVCDGYMETAPQEYLMHFDWGWNGMHNGYVATSPMIASNGMVFTLSQNAILNIYPDQVQEPTWSFRPDFAQKRLTSEEGSILYHPLVGSTTSNPKTTQITIIPDVDSVSATLLFFTAMPTMGDHDSLWIYQYNGGVAQVAFAYGKNAEPILYQAHSVQADSCRVVLAHHNVLDKPFAFSYSAAIGCFCSEQITLRTSSGIIDDGSHSKRYTNHTQCKWRIFPTVITTNAIRLSFQAFDLEDQKDFLYILTPEGDTLDRLTGNRLPPEKVYPYRRLILSFVSNYENQRDGFRVAYQGLTPESVFENDTETAAIQCYPSVCKDNLTVSMNHSDEVIVSIFNLSGNKVLQKIIPKGERLRETTCDISAFAAGVYMVQLQTPSKTYLFKIVKI